MRLQRRCESSTISTRLHKHPQEDEYFYVCEGGFRFRTHDDVAEAHTGGFVFVPRTVPDCFQNVGDGDGRLLVFFTPADSPNPVAMPSPTLELVALGCVTGLLGAVLGQGGGIFIVPALTGLFGMPIRTAVASAILALLVAFKPHG